MEVGISANLRKGFRQMNKGFVSALYVINIAVQAIFTLLTPPAALFFIAWLFVSHLSAPKWIYAVAIILGVFIGLYTMVRFVLSAMRSLEALEMQRTKREKDAKVKNKKDNGNSDEKE